MKDVSAARGPEDRPRTSAGDAAEELDADVHASVRDALADFESRNVVLIGALLAVAVVALASTWSSTDGFPLAFALAATSTVASFALALTWASRRVARLAAARSLESHGARLLRARRDELVAANRELELSNQELLAAQAQTELLAQLVVHDLKNPLAVVMANVSLAHGAISRLPTLEPESEALEIALSEAQRLSGMIGDLLLVSRLERRELKGLLLPARVRSVLDGVARATEVRSSAKGVRVEVVGPPDLSATIDAALLRRMVENLVSNALRYTTQGGRIELAATADGELVRVAVRNTGPAVSAAARARLFEKYATHGAGDPQNCGIGLYLCRLVADVHRGRIALVEREGWNVSFEVELPVRAAQHARR